MLLQSNNAYASVSLTDLLERIEALEAENVDQQSLIDALDAENGNQQGEIEELNDRVEVLEGCVECEPDRFTINKPNTEKQK